MSDDFDKDDLSWLQDDDEQSDDDQQEEFDWQQSEDDGKTKAPPGGNLGFTTELPWMQGEVTGPDAAKGEDFDWQTEESGDDEDENDAGDLDWQDEPAAELDDDVDWQEETQLEDDAGDFGSPVVTPLDLDLDDFGDVGAPVAPPAEQGDMPDWLSSGTPDDLGDFGDLGTPTSESVTSDPGALPDWLGSTPAAFDDPGEKSAPEKPAQSGVPDWLRGSESAEDMTDFSEISSPPEAESLRSSVPDWLQPSLTEDDDEPLISSAPRSAPIEDVPDWLTGTTGEPPLPPTEDDVDIYAGPDWLRGDDEPDPLTDVPDWLAGDAPRETSGMVDDTGSLSADWLASGAELPDAAQSDQTFDDWFDQQQAASRPRDLEDQMPGLEQLAGAADDEGGTGELPDWFLGMEELDTSDAPAWFAGDLPSTDNLTGDVNPAAWLAGEPEADSSELDDFFAALDEQAAPTTGLDDDFFADLDVPEAEPDEPAAPATGLGDDFFADLEEPEAEPEEADDFFAAMNAAPGAASEFDDFLAAFGDDDSGAETQPDAEMDDFFANLDVGDSGDFDDLEPVGAAGEPDTDMGDIDGFLAGLEEPETADELGDDFFASLEEPQGSILDDVPEEPDAEFLSAVSEAEEDLDTESLEALFNADMLANVADGDILSALGLEDDEAEAPAEEAEAVNWFADEPAPDDLAAAGWLDDIEDFDEAELQEAMASFDDLPSMSADGLTDIDRLLADFETEEEQLPDTGSLLSEEADFDTLFSDPAFSDISPTSPGGDDIQPETPDWLTEAGATIGGPSAAAILRGQEDRPLEELPDRLQRLRDRSAAKELAKGDIGLDAFVPDVGETAAASQMGLAGIAGDIVLTPPQSGYVDLLKQLTAGEQASVAAGRRRAVSEDPFLLDEDEQLEAETDAVVKQPRRSLVSRIKFTRLLIALLVAAAVIVPFVSDIRIGEPPPAAFGVGSRQQVVFNTLAALEPGQRVLVAMEYGPTGAAELDSAARVLLQHMLAQGVQPVVVSTNPVALLRADNLLTELGRIDSPLLDTIGRDTPLRSNEDYVVARYLPANATGLRAFAMNPGPQLALDLRGQPTQLTINGLNDFTQIVIVAEHPDDLRAWAEQIAPLTQFPLLAAIGRSAEPLIEPYLGTGIDGLLVGYTDTLTYANLLSTDIDAQLIDPNVTLRPTVDVNVPPTLPSGEAGVIVASQPINVRSGPGSSFEVIGSAAPGTEVVVLESNDDGSWNHVVLPDGTDGWVASNLVLTESEALPTATPLPTETPALTETSAPTDSATATPGPTETPAPTETPTETATLLPTDTPVPTNTVPPTNTPVPTATVETQVVARVVSDGSVNIRSGPNTTFAPVGTASPGDEFVVLGRNADGSWIQIDYPGLVAGQEAWIADFLLEIGVAPASAARPDRIVVVMAGSDFSGLLVQAQPMATETPPVELPPIAVEQALPQAEQRWYAMNLGLLVIILVIIVGTLVNIARAILRRRA